jgi:hypothetical protein
MLNQRALPAIRLNPPDVQLIDILSAEVRPDRMTASPGENAAQDRL